MMAEHKLEPSRLLALLDESVPPGILDDFLDDLPSFSRSRRQWQSLVRRRVCPVCGEQILIHDDFLWVVDRGIRVAAVHRGDCNRVTIALAHSYRQGPTGRRRTRTEWQRLIDTVWRAGLTRPALAAAAGE
jgi:hypothetical protein